MSARFRRSRPISLLQAALWVLGAGCSGYEPFPPPAPRLLDVSALDAGAAPVGVLRVVTGDPGGGLADAASRDAAGVDVGAAGDGAGGQADVLWWDAGSAGSGDGGPDGGSPQDGLGAGSGQDGAEVDSGPSTDLDSASLDAPDGGLLLDTSGTDGASADTSGGADGGGAGGQDAGPKGTIEPCNGLDDNGDGRVDEGCYPGPNLRPDQAWADLGAFALASAPLPTPARALKLGPKQTRAVLLARDLKPGAWLLWGDRLQGPDGKVWLAAGTWSAAPNRGGVNTSVSSLLIGGAPEVLPAAGTWAFGFARTNMLPVDALDAISGWMHLGAVVAPPLGASAAAVDLDVYLVGGQPFTAKQAPTSAVWQQMRKRVEAIWAPAKLVIGDVTFTDVLGKDGDKYLYVDDIAAAGAANELDGLMALSAVHRPKSTAVSLYLVASLEADGVAVAAGVTGQLCGVAGLQGSRASGIALAIPKDGLGKLLKADPSGELAGEHYGAVLAHELGHYLGLWHTVEKDGVLSDPLADTPGCELPAGTSTYSAAACPASAKNLMFWGESSVAVSPGQVLVIRRHPALRVLP